MTIRVGFLGAGLIATYHSKSLRASGEDVIWSGVYDPDRARAERFARDTGAPVFASEEEVLDTCDAVYVCTWTSEHPRLVQKALDRRLAVFCEKPLATSAEAARAMADAVDAAGVTNMVGLVLRRSPAFHLLAGLVHDPAAGPLQAVVFRDDQYLPTTGMYASTWRGEVDKAGAGTLLEHSIHDVDLLAWLAGDAVTVTGMSASHHDLPGIEDTVVATMHHATGAISSLVSVWHDVVGRPSLRRVEALCRDRWVVLEGDWFGPVRWSTNGEGERSLAGDALVEAVSDTDAQIAPDRSADAVFVRAAREGAPASPSFRDAVAAHDVVDAVYRSAAAGGAPAAVGIRHRGETQS